MALTNLPKNIEDFISKGGSVTGNAAPKPEKDNDSCRIVLRLPKSFLDLLDKEREKRLNKPYRNQFILELLSNALNEQK
jgi:hypothetical protein